MVLYDKWKRKAIFNQLTLGFCHASLTLSSKNFLSSIYTRFKRVHIFLKRVWGELIWRKTHKLQERPFHMAAQLQTVCWSFPLQKSITSPWKSQKKNTISPRLLPRRNFHFKSYLWGRKLHKLRAEIFQTTSLTNSHLQSYPTPKARWTYANRTMTLTFDWSISHQSNHEYWMTRRKDWTGYVPKSKWLLQFEFYRASQVLGETSIRN